MLKECLQFRFCIRTFRFDNAIQNMLKVLVLIKLWKWLKIGKVILAEFIKIYIIYLVIQFWSCGLNPKVGFSMTLLNCIQHGRRCTLWIENVSHYELKMCHCWTNHPTHISSGWIIGNGMNHRKVLRNRVNLVIFTYLWGDPLYSWYIRF